jgi:threonine/homoserine/homoserine lactone efflux protein
MLVQSPLAVRMPGSQTITLPLTDAMDLIFNFPLFIVASISLALLPGPDTLITLGKTLTAGRRAGFLVGAGIGLGCLVHLALSAFGLSALLAASPALFSLVQWAGALYLAWLGAQMLRAQAGGAAVPKDAGDPRQTARQLLRSGFITNVLNPKVGLFFISFLPQFVHHGPALETALALALLGFTFVLIGMAWICVVVMAADAMVARTRRSAAISLWMQRGVGVIFVGIAARMALAEK